MTKLAIRLLIFTLLFAAIPASAQFENRTTDKPHPDAPAELNDFARFIGTWEYDSLVKTEEGIKKAKGVWQFRYFLWGLGIADDYWTKSPEGLEYYGSTYRIFNTVTNRWEIEVVNAKQQTYWMEIVGPHQPGDSMQFTGMLKRKDMPDYMMKIYYTDIKADSFEWHSDDSNDGGKTWTENALVVHARRVK